MSVYKPGLAVLMCLAVLGLTAARANAAAHHAYLCKVPYGPNAGKPAPVEGTSYADAAVDGRTTHSIGEGAAVIYTAPAAA
jgi:hypothetical protein